VVQPIHEKAMPVMPMTAEDVDVWLKGTREEALELQKPQPDDSLVITPYDEKKAA
jgi:putative SOS response-associated peptidase YedK